VAPSLAEYAVRDAIPFQIIEESQIITLNMMRYGSAPRGRRKRQRDAPLQHDIKQKNLRSSATYKCHFSLRACIVVWSYFSSDSDHKRTADSKLIGHRVEDKSRRHKRRSQETIAISARVAQQDRSTPIGGTGLSYE
jgi:hypothetical protein